MDKNDEELEIRPILPGDRLNQLSLGDPIFLPLKTFLAKHAKTFQERSLARTYGAFVLGERPKIVGYHAGLR